MRILLNTSAYSEFLRWHRELRATRRTVILLSSVYGPEELTEGRARRTRWIGRLIGLVYLATLVLIPLL